MCFKPLSFHGLWCHELDPMEDGLFDMPHYDHTEDEPFPPLPPPHSPGQGAGEEADPFENGDGEGEVSKLAEVPAAKRTAVKRPQPKLDSQRLTSDRGLPALRTLFDNVHFKGKGHEAEDLRLLMQKMENWAHRLYPKLQFEDFIDKVEKLGSKKEVQTCLKRIRLDMPLTHDDFISRDDEEAAAPAPQVFQDPDPFGGGGFPDHLQGPVHSTPAPAAPALTEEQRKRMELNRQLALEKRLARKQQQQQQHTDVSDSQPLSSSADQASASSLSLSQSQPHHAHEDSDPERSSRSQQPSQAPVKDSELSSDLLQSAEEESSLSVAPALHSGCQEGTGAV
ncbi:TIMELESS-interacting protein isoform X2 [Myripristis murdjan]|uniref:TIMELESS-interacting protein isoform X2 n=1 Tax=Myripristis murdjan TaxID=586833 RepID=UPI0011763135|nr:TIMELESS-interacting protein isoform X2 [Myripristis murdjan]